jgi:hypothetical protein
MMIGEHEAIRREHKPGTLAPPGVDAADGGADAFDGIDDGARVRVEQPIV